MSPPCGGRCRRGRARGRARASCPTGAPCRCRRTCHSATPRRGWACGRPRFLGHTAPPARVWGWVQQQAVGGCWAEAGGGAPAADAQPPQTADPFHTAWRPCPHCRTPPDDQPGRTLGVSVCPSGGRSGKGVKMEDDMRFLLLAARGRPSPLGPAATSGCRRSSAARCSACCWRRWGCCCGAPADSSPPPLAPPSPPGRRPQLPQPPRPGVATAPALQLRAGGARAAGRPRGWALNRGLGAPGRSAACMMIAATRRSPGCVQGKGGGGLGVVSAPVELGGAAHDQTACDAETREWNLRRARVWRVWVRRAAGATCRH